MDYRAEQHKLEVRELAVKNDMLLQAVVGIGVILVGFLLIFNGVL